MADVSSAQAMFAAYCAQNSGTTAFPVPSPPPGDSKLAKALGAASNPAADEDSDLLHYGFAAV
jgi:hypothetical protein